MKNSIIILCILAFFCKKTNAQSFEWAKRAGSYAFDLGYGVGADNAGNVYIAGKYEMNAYFGGTYVGCKGNHDIYLAKYGPDGSFKWVRTAGGSIGDYAHAIAVDGAGNSYITGEYETTTYFGSIALTSRGNNDVFVAKYDTNGNLVWVRNLAGGGGNDRGLSISTSAGNVYISGRFQGTAYFGGTQVVTSGGIDIFVAKYTTAGVFQWVKKAGGSGDDEGHAISSDLAGNAYVTGYFTGTANFSGTSVTSKGGTDVFIAKYNSSGNILWVKRAGAGANDAGNAIKADNSGRIFVTGGFRYTSYFGSIPITAPGGNSDVFIVRYDTLGNVVWAKKAGGTDNDSGRGIAIDGSANVFITGNCGQIATFGSTTLSGADITEIYFASYDVSGNFRWVLKAGGVADASDPDRFIEMGLSIATDPAGNVFASGAYRSSSTFGATTLAPWSTHTEVYVTKIKQGRTAEENSLNAAIIPSGTTSFCTGGSVVLRAIEDSSKIYLWKKNGTIIKEASGASYKASSPGSYSVIIIKDNDSLISEPTIVNETQKITASIMPSGLVFCRDSNTVLRANEGDDYIYQWKRNGKSIPGATASAYKPDRSGDYQVKIIQGSCFDWSGNIKVKVESCDNTDSMADNNKDSETGITEAKEDSLLVKIYPNPNNGLFTLEINMPHANEQAEQAKVEVINAMGQVVYFKQVTCNNGYLNEHIELESSVSTGIYFLQVSIGDKVEKTRMMLCR